MNDARSAADERARRAWRQLRGMAERHLDALRSTRAALDLGLSPVMAHFLRTLVDLPPGPMSQLVSHLHVDPAWVTDVVDRLETRGYVVRVASTVDRRVKIVEVTDAGRAAWRAAQELIATPPPELLQLPAEDLDALIRIGERIDALASARPEGRPGAAAPPVGRGRRRGRPAG